MKTPDFYIVEDEPIIAASIKLMLIKKGFNVIGISDEYEIALLEIINKKPNLVLIDIKLEGKKSGIDLALQLDHLKVKYYYLSSLADPITKTTIKNTNPLGFINKPFTEFGLLRQLKTLGNYL